MASFDEFPEFHNDENVLWFDVSTIEQFIDIDPRKVAANIIPNLNGKTRIVFDHVNEGQVKPWLHFIYQLIKALKISHKQVTYITSALEAPRLLDEYLQKYKLTEKICLIVTNRWEIHVKHSTQPCEFVFGPKKKTFLSFNRIIRIHRLALFGLLAARGLVEKGHYSFFRARITGKRLDDGNTEIIEGLAVLNESLQILRSQVSSETFHTIRQYAQAATLPLTLNSTFAENINFLRPTDEPYFRTSYFSLVTETHFFPHIRNSQENLHEVFFTEKTYKPIGMKHPFILVAPAHSLEHLRGLGYQTFSPFIDETYDTIKDHEGRLQAIVAEVVRLDKQTPEEWAAWETHIAPIVKHNYDVLMSNREYIVGRYPQ